VRGHQEARLEVELVVRDACGRGLALRDVLARGALALPVGDGDRCRVCGRLPAPPVPDATQTPGPADLGSNASSPRPQFPHL
jgi:hypothetical protein